MSANDQEVHGGQARIHNKMLPWRAAKTSGGPRGAMYEQQADQSLQLARKQAGYKERLWQNLKLNCVTLMRTTTCRRDRAHCRKR